MDEVNWRGFELTGVRIDLVQAVQFARAHGALVLGLTRSSRMPCGPVSSAFRPPSSPRTATAMRAPEAGVEELSCHVRVGQRHEHRPR